MGKKGRCRRQTAKFARWGWSILGKSLFPKVGELFDSVRILTAGNPGWLTGHDKRDLVIKGIKQEYKRLGGELTVELAKKIESAVRAEIERLVFITQELDGTVEDGAPDADDEINLPDPDEDEEEIDHEGDIGVSRG